MGSEGEQTETECSTSTSMAASQVCIECKEEFSGKLPRMLTCLHNMCTNCFEKAQQEAITALHGQEANGQKTPENAEAVISCPQCKEKMRCCDTVENPFVKIVEKESAEGKGEESKKHMCACGDGDEAQEGTSFCVDCCEWLCQECVQAHRRVRLTRDHSIKSEEDAPESAPNSNKESMLEFCRRHPLEKPQFFCETCDVLTCRDCQLVEHKDHKYSFLTAACDAYKQRLLERQEQLKKNKEKLIKLSGLLEQKIAQVKDEKETVLRKVQVQADMLIKRIIQAARQILVNLASVSDAASTRFSRDCNDVTSLLNKHNYVLAFVENILSEGSPSGLLHTKALVEKHCIKLDKHPPELPSLKGQLQFQYRHNVGFLLENIHHFGCIYVNGIRYPPDKNQIQKQQLQQQQQQQHHHQQQQHAHQPHAVGQGPPPQAIPDRSKVILAYMMQQQQQQQQQSQGQSQPQPQPQPQLGPPPLYNRGLGPQQVGAMSQRFQFNKGWMPQRVPGSNPSMFPMSGQGAHMPAQPGFTPMRLHHRPVTTMQASVAGPAPPFPSGMVVHSTSGSSNMAESVYRAQQHPPPPPLISSISSSNGSVSQRPGSAHSTQAGGEPNSERPRSHESSLSRVKKERNDDFDCFITAASIKGEKKEGQRTSPSSSQPDKGVPTSLSQDIDEVLRTLPQECPTFESISGSPSEGLTESASAAATSALAAVKATSVSPTSSSQSTASTSAPPMATLHQGAYPISQGKNIDNYQSQSSTSIDPNDDYCACCHNGGDVLCCDLCPRVYHLPCHIPPLPSVPAGSFECTMCLKENELKLGEEETSSLKPGSKRRASNGLTKTEQKICERILLDLFCHQSSIPFHEPVKKNTPNYYKLITHPMDFTSIKCKLNRGHFQNYTTIESFLSDVRQVFNNCAIYNHESSEVGKCGKAVRKHFEELVDEYLPGFGAFVREKGPTLAEVMEAQGCFDHHGTGAVPNGPTVSGDSPRTTEPEPKRAKLSPDPVMHIS